MWLLMSILSIVFSFGLNAVIVYGCCWGLGIIFTWKLAIGVWFASMLLRSIFNKSK